MPVKCCESRIWRIYPWICAAAFVSCVLGVVALGSPSWTEGRYGDYQYLQTGLLRFCHHRNSQSGHNRCAPLVFGSQESWLEAARLLSLLSWILMLSVLVMSVVLHFLDDDFTFSLPIVIVALFAVVLGIIGAIVYVIPWSTRNILEKYDVNISWGYAVCIVWHVITLLLFILLCIMGRDIWQNQYKANRRHH